MAEALTEDIKEKVLKCGICLMTYQNPRGLPCQHAFCHGCLEKWAKESEDPKVLLCPHCKQPTPIPDDGIQGFPPQSILHSLDDTINTSQKVRGIYKYIKPIKTLRKVVPFYTPVL